MKCSTTCKAGMFVILAAVATTHGDGAGEPAPSTVVVDIRDLAYAPADLEVRPGDTVRWINHDIVPHTVTSRHAPDSGSRTGATVALASGLLAEGAAFEVVPTVPGVLAYQCLYHPTMQGRLIVAGVDELDSARANAASSRR